MIFSLTPAKLLYCAGSSATFSHGEMRGRLKTTIATHSRLLLTVVTDLLHADFEEGFYPTPEELLERQKELLEDLQGLI